MAACNQPLSPDGCRLIDRCSWLPSMIPGRRRVLPRAIMPYFTGVAESATILADRMSQRQNPAHGNS